MSEATETCRFCPSPGAYRSFDCEGLPLLYCALHLVKHAQKHAKCTLCFGQNGVTNVFRERMEAKKNRTNRPSAMEVLLAKVKAQAEAAA